PHGDEHGGREPEPAEGAEADALGLAEDEPVAEQERRIDDAQEGARRVEQRRLAPPLQHRHDGGDAAEDEERLGEGDERPERGEGAQHQAEPRQRTRPGLAQQRVDLELGPDGDRGHEQPESPAPDPQQRQGERHQDEGREDPLEKIAHRGVAYFVGRIANGPAYDLRGTTYAVRPTRYDLRGTTYAVRPTRYDLRGTTYAVRPTRYDLRGTT